MRLLGRQISGGGQEDCRGRTRYRKPLRYPSAYEPAADDRLVEMGFGIYEGIENSFAIKDCPINSLFKNPEDYVTVEGGESFEQLFARTGEFIDNVVMPQVNSGKDILIVGHGAMNCSIIAKFRGTPLDKFWDGMTDNCQVVKLI